MGHVTTSMAVLDGPRLVRDMEVFRDEARAFLESEGGIPAEQSVKEIGHALTHYAIIFLVRSARQLPANLSTVLREFRALVRSSVCQESVLHYTSGKGTSTVVPLLIRWKAERLLALVCTYKALRRYGLLRPA
jgi:hypothetical protein